MAIKVLIVDDSALIRSLLSEMISASPDFIVVGTAKDPFEARDMVNHFTPDVITLDIEMPRMDGLTFLDKLMRARPTPVVMISTLTEQGSEATFKAMELGAIDFVPKPKIGVVEGMQAYRDDILDKLRSAAQAKILKRLPPVRKAVKVDEVMPKATKPGGLRDDTGLIVALGASTGGPEALKRVIMALPPDFPSVVITQHMPPGFTSSFAARLDRLSQLTVLEAKGDERILPGHVYIAPGDQHLVVERFGRFYVTKLSDAPPVFRHKPSVDVLFRSVANAAGPNAVAALFTGMGKDGAQGMLDIYQAGGMTMAQDEASCVVYGMPREAVALGGVHEQHSLGQMPRQLIHHVAQRQHKG
ncbi:two-component system, chemotaxis family, response regulator CheB [Atopomonas hussainii]|uniref:Protein-glutamate methylesterase/protein-glutamine glutaminase n=1 Tax=Atopomonas hussainii TaxID=1429083 RepID=A0A1H7SXU9_9GAMM|nr:chemotaxis response regulator protein-glutamate methylesterase [Atopomonas hussainii]SEL77155.1 two-component system, chemotaxis family, response regulator CheB [Atopomonas hussainii]